MSTQAFRFMFSPTSCIMSIHFIVLNPFFYEQKVKKDATIINQLPARLQPIGINNQETFSSIATLATDDKLDTSNQHNVFLGRNLRKMKAIRKEHESSLRIHNGMHLNVIPLA